jgi:probable O-glycosylation ligase (exosortase A-associated)
MNPHRLTYGLLYVPAAKIVAILTLVGFVIKFRQYHFPKSREALLISLQLVWFTVTTQFALIPEKAWPKWEITIKTLLMTLLLLALFGSSTRVRQLLLVISLSIAFYGVKGGIFGILTGGQYRIWGPEQSFIADNNALALAELMILPLLIAFWKESTHRLLRCVLFATTLLTVGSIMLSYSRGALVGLLAFIAFFLARSRNRIRYLVATSILAVLLLGFLPQGWMDRMKTIGNYQQDSSAISRINSWVFAYHLAADRPLLGGGFKAFDRTLFQVYAPSPTMVYDAHSIYFELLGEQGYPGLILFLGLTLSVLLTLSWIRKHAHAIPQHAWMTGFATMLQVSIACFLVGGAFLGLAYFDLYYYLIVVCASMKGILQRELAHQNAASENAHSEPNIKGYPPLNKIFDGAA